jgi:hypothetical protein
MPAPSSSSSSWSSAAALASSGASGGQRTNDKGAGRGRGRAGADSTKAPGGGAPRGTGQLAKLQPGGDLEEQVQHQVNYAVAVLQHLYMQQLNHARAMSASHVGGDPTAQAGAAPGEAEEAGGAHSVEDDGAAPASKRPSRSTRRSSRISKHPTKPGSDSRGAGGQDRRETTIPGMLERLSNICKGGAAVLPELAVLAAGAASSAAGSTHPQAKLLAAQASHLRAHIFSVCKQHQTIVTARADGAGAARAGATSGRKLSTASSIGSPGGIPGGSGRGSSIQSVNSSSPRTLGSDAPSVTAIPESIAMQILKAAVPPQARKVSTDSSSQAGLQQGASPAHGGPVSASAALGDDDLRHVLPAAAAGTTPVPSSSSSAAASALLSPSTARPDLSAGGLQPFAEDPGGHRDDLPFLGAAGGALASAGSLLGLPAMPPARGRGLSLEPGDGLPDTPGMAAATSEAAASASSSAAAGGSGTAPPGPHALLGAGASGGSNAGGPLSAVAGMGSRAASGDHSLSLVDPDALAGASHVPEGLADAGTPFGSALEQGGDAFGAEGDGMEGFGGSSGRSGKRGRSGSTASRLSDAAGLSGSAKASLPGSTGRSSSGGSSSAAKSRKSRAAGGALRSASGFWAPNTGGDE